MPSGIRQTTRSDGTSEYVVTGIFTNGAASRIPMPNKHINLYIDKIPCCTTGSLSVATRELRFVTTTPITNMPSVIDELARFGGDVPYWDELVARDSRSPSFTADLYSLVSITSNATETISGKTDLQWHSITRIQPVNLRIRYAPWKDGILRFNRSTAFCMSCNRFAMRIEDEGGKCIWEDTDNVYANCRVAITDRDGDGVDEIVIFRNDHDFRFHTLIWERSPRPISASSFKAQIDLAGTWCYMETNRYGGNSRYSNETYVTTTHYQFTTNGRVRVIEYTPQQGIWIQLRGFLNTKHVGTYAIDGNRMTVSAKEVSGYVRRPPSIDESYVFGGDREVLSLTNTTSGKVRSLKRADNWLEPPRGDGKKPPPWP